MHVKQPWIVTLTLVVRAPDELTRAALESALANALGPKTRKSRDTLKQWVFEVPNGTGKDEADSASLARANIKQRLDGALRATGIGSCVFSLVAGDQEPMYFDIQ